MADLRQEIEQYVAKRHEFLELADDYQRFEEQNGVIVDGLVRIRQIG